MIKSHKGYLLFLVLNYVLIFQGCHSFLKDDLVGAPTIHVNQKSHKINMRDSTVYLFRTDCACNNCFDSAKFILNYIYPNFKLLLVNATAKQKNVERRFETQSIVNQTGFREDEIIFIKMACFYKKIGYNQELISPFVIISTNAKLDTLKYSMFNDLIIKFKNR